MTFFRFGMPCPHPIFILGTGRSGTHWIADTLAPHPELAVTYEVEPRFGYAKSMALNPSTRQALLKKHIRNYQWAQRWFSPQRLVDKAHPNIWIAEDLLEAFPNALFLGTHRDVYATVASMINCQPVNAWHKTWKQFPIPNHFLGITPEIAPFYESLSNPEQCTLRWLSHRDRMQYLQQRFPNQLLVVNYESLMDQAEKTLDEIKAFLKLKSPISVPTIKSESRSKWHEFLSQSDVERIDAIIAEWNSGSTRLPKSS